MDTTLTLRPHQWTELPDTGLAILWEGDDTVDVHADGGGWDLSALTRPGHVRAWVRVVRDGRPASPPWPLMPLPRPTTYRAARPAGTAGAGRHRAADAAGVNAGPVRQATGGRVGGQRGPVPVHRAGR